ncbi:MAG: HD domain-containing protein [Anaerolineae bacterium]
MKSDRVLSVLRAANRLKLVPRTGWLLRGVQPAESVADHTYGVALTALLLADLIVEPVDRVRLLIMALLHDLAESVTGDIPTPAGRFFPPEAKEAAEEQAVASLLEDWPAGDAHVELWREYKEASTVEGRLVRDADRLEMLLQADAYERAGATGLDEFWDELTEEKFAFSATWQIVQQLVEARCRET